jgi:hypothetical protein
MNATQATKQSPQERKPQSELQSQYRRIAISAVVAALPYGGETRKSSDAAAEARD